MGRHKKASARAGHWKIISTGIYAAIFLAVVFGGLGSIGYLIRLSDQQDGSKLETQYINEFRSLTVSQREFLARELLNMQSRNIALDVGDKKSEILNALNQTAQTGVVPQLDLYPGSWHYFTATALPDMGVGTAALATLWVSISYVRECSRRRTYLVDLPLRPWAICFVVLTPLLWPFYVRSAIKRRKARKRKAKRAAAQRQQAAIARPESVPNEPQPEQPVQIAARAEPENSPIIKEASEQNAPDAHD